MQAGLPPRRAESSLALPIPSAVRGGAGWWGDAMRGGARRGEAGRGGARRGDARRDFDGFLCWRRITHWTRRQPHRPLDPSPSPVAPLTSDRSLKALILISNGVLLAPSHQARPHYRDELGAGLNRWATTGPDLICRAGRGRAAWDLVGVSGGCWGCWAARWRRPRAARGPRLTATMT